MSENKKSTPECRKGCDVCKDWCKLEAENTSLILNSGDLIEALEEIIRINMADYGMCTDVIRSNKMMEVAKQVLSKYRGEQK